MESLGLDWKLLLAQMVNFGLLFFVLKKVLFKPLIKVIDDRNKKISGAVKNSQQIEEKLKDIEEEKTKLLEKAKAEAKKEKEELVKVAQVEKEKIIEDAKLSAKREVDKGLSSIEQAKKDAVKDISDAYLKKLESNLLERFSENSKKNNFPLIKSLLK